MPLLLAKHIWLANATNKLLLSRNSQNKLVMLGGNWAQDISWRKQRTKQCSKEFSRMCVFLPDKVCDWAVTKMVQTAISPNCCTYEPLTHLLCWLGWRKRQKSTLPVTFRTRASSARLVNVFFSIMANEYTDIANKEQFAVCLCWVDESLTTHEVGYWSV